MEKDCWEDGCDCCEAPPSCGGCILTGASMGYSDRRRG